MKGKESLKVIIFFLILVIGVGGFLIYKGINNPEEIQEEYIPEEEISQEQERQTMITLYFVEKETNKIIPEVRKVDSKKLLKEPYMYLLEELKNGSSKENIQKIIPEGTNINNVKLNKDILEIDFSKEFIEKSDIENRKLSIEAILKTMSELNEVNGIKIIIDGNENNKENDLENVYYKNN